MVNQCVCDRLRGERGRESDFFNGLWKKLEVVEKLLDYRSACCMSIGTHTYTQTLVHSNSLLAITKLVRAETRNSLKETWYNKIKVIANKVQTNPSHIP